jgi:uncharacterized protein with HEPN domain
MPKDPTIAIRDCLGEIAILHDIAARMTLQTFRNDPIVRRAAAYAIQTISEAVRHVPDDWLADFPTEPWGQIKGISNRIRHEYFRIDDAILWEIITTDTHAMKTAMEAMLAACRRELGVIETLIRSCSIQMRPPWPRRRRRLTRCFWYAAISRAIGPV